MSGTLKREAIVAVVLVAFGLIALPAAVFWVGRHVVGQYGGGSGGVWDLTRAVWLALLQGQIAAWLLVLGPYIVVQLIRVTAVVWHARKPEQPVNDVTNSHGQRRRL